METLKENEQKNNGNSIKTISFDDKEFYNKYNLI